MMHDVVVLVLAAGRGKRMQAKFKDLPKVLIPVAGRSMIRRVVDSIVDSGIALQIVVVVSPDSIAMVKNELSSYPIELAVQENPLGTGNAVLSAKDVARPCNTTLVLCADQPLISPTTLRKLLTAHQAANAHLTLLTAQLNHFEGRLGAFQDWGRIIRDSSGQVVRIVEARDASESELKIREVNPAIYCFDSHFLWSALVTLAPCNAQGEYQLTDLIETAVSASLKVHSVAAADPLELLGANEPSQLEVLEVLTRELSPKADDSSATASA